jgi:hypothetical protein
MKGTTIADQANEQLNAPLFGYLKGRPRTGLNREKKGGDPVWITARKRFKYNDLMSWLKVLLI